MTTSRGGVSVFLASAPLVIRAARISFLFFVPGTPGVHGRHRLLSRHGNGGCRVLPKNMLRGQVLI